MRQHRRRPKGTFTVLPTVLLTLLLPTVEYFSLGRAEAAGTFVVNSSGDVVEPDSVLTLREAISVANGARSRPYTASEQRQLGDCTFNSSGFIVSGCGRGGDVIRFSVPMVNLTSGLPAITTEAVRIEGNAGVPRIDGRSMGTLGSTMRTALDAFTVNANNVTLSGISVVNVPPGTAKLAFAAIRILGGRAVSIRSNYLGTLPPSAGVTRCRSAEGSIPPPLVSRNASHGIVIGPDVSGDGSTPSASIVGNTIVCHAISGIAISGAGFVTIGEGGATESGLRPPTSNSRTALAWCSLKARTTAWSPTTPLRPIATSASGSPAA